MPVPVIADVYRVVINWNSVDGVAPRNVFHLYAPGAAIEDIATALDLAFGDGSSPSNMFYSMPTAFTATSVSITKLDGTSPAIDFSIDTISGSRTGDWMPAVAAVVSFKTAQKGARGRGRMYIGPLAEISQNTGVLTSGDQTTMLVGWDNFLDSLQAADKPFTIASYQHADHHELTSHRVDNLVGTMRRRQDQLR